jgi:very-short-patch-repair endonuclease
VRTAEILGGPDVDPTIRRLAGRQDGVVDPQAAACARYPGKRIDHRVRIGRLIVVYRGVYAVGHDALSDRGRIRAALLAVGPRASASHTTAAYLDHLAPTLPAVLHVTTLGRAPRDRDGLIVHETTRPFAPRTVGGFRATPTPRTLEDLGWPDKLVREAAARGLIRPQDVPSKIDATPTQSELERRMRRLCAAAGLPQPIVQYPIAPYKIDFAWPEHRVLVETDGWGTHGRRQAFEDDRAKDADLAARGFVVIRFTWRQLEEEPYTVAARLAAALALREASTPVAP